MTSSNAAATAESIRQQFGASAAAYAVSAVHASGPDLQLMVAAANIQGGERVVDMGSGAGHTAMAFAAKGAHVTGIDLTPEMVAVATELARQRSLANVTFEQGDVTALPFDAGSVDVVTSRYSAHHFADPAGALAEAARVLLPGGRFLLVDVVAPEEAALDTFLNAFELLRDPSHVRDWRASEWVRMLGAAGFEPRVLHRAGIVQDFGEWTRRMRTPEAKAAVIETLFREANTSQARAFELNCEGPGQCAFSIPIALVEGVKRA